MLRFTDPNRPRPFKAPLGLTFPILGIIGCIGVMCTLPAETWVITLVWFVLGLTLYFSYGFKHSTLAKAVQTENPDAQHSLADAETVETKTLLLH
jgi:APA family basic amino acid/polyamine antiporter